MALLSAPGEAAWARLKRHLDRSRSFWLAFVFSDASGDLAVLRERAAGNRAGATTDLVVVAPTSSGGLARALETIERDGSPPPGCTWVEPTHLGPDRDGEWLAGWTELLQTVNHRRDSLRARLGGLVLVLPPWARSQPGRVSSDLWSVRSLVMDLPSGTAEDGALVAGPPRDLAERRTLDRGLPDSMSGMLRHDDTLGWTEDADTDDGLYDEGTALLEVGPADLAGREGDRARALVERAERSGRTQLAALVLERLTEGFVEVRDPAAARSVLEHALTLSDVEDRTRMRLLYTASRFAGVEASLAADRAEAALAIAEALAGRTWTTPEAMRNLSINLDNVSLVRRVRGDWAGAEDAYARSLSVREGLAARVGTLERMLDLSVSLDNMGSIREARGDWAGAEKMYTRSLAVRDRLADRVGTAEAVRDLSVSLNDVGRVREARGDLAGAEEVYARSLSLAEDLAWERMPDELWHLSNRLDNVGRVREARGDLAGAEDAYARSLGLREDLAQRVGTPEALRDLSVSLWLLGNLAVQADDHSRGEQLLRRALDVRDGLPARVRTHDDEDFLRTTREALDALG